MIEGLLYVAGALLVLTGAFMPVAARVYGTRDPAAQAGAVEAAPGAWRWHHILFAAGASVTASAALWEAIGPDQAALVAAAAAFVLGAVFFVHFLLARLAAQPQAWFAGTLGRRRFMAFTVLTALGLMLRGVAALQAGQAGGGMLVGYGALILLLYAWKQDMPPLAHYVGTLAWGFVLLP